MPAALHRLVVAGLLVALASGCVERTLNIQSEPPGATVYLDGFDVGQTPIKQLRFDFYGTREIVAVRPGHRTERRVVEIDAPWWQHFPLDIVPGLLLPWTVHDRRHACLVLDPVRPAKRDDLFARAGVFKDTARAVIRREREASSYRPRAYVIPDDDDPFILFAPFVGIPRAEPSYKGNDRPRPAPNRDRD
jgi:hypothetical protein